jgi:hypothetical protein
MNFGITNFEMPKDHVINITPCWLLGFIEGEGSFHLTVSDKKKKNQLTFL